MGRGKEEGKEGGRVEGKEEGGREVEKAGREKAVGICIRVDSAVVEVDWEE